LREVEGPIEGKVGAAGLLFRAEAVDRKRRNQRSVLLKADEEFCKLPSESSWSRKGL